MRANDVLMLFLIHRGLWSKTLNETIHALVCIFLPEVIRAPNPRCSWFLFLCQPVFTACHPSAGEGISLSALQAGVPPLSTGKDVRQEAAAAPEPQLCPAPKRPWPVTESLGDKGSAGFCGARAGAGPRHSSHHPSGCADTGTAPGHSWPGLGCTGQQAMDKTPVWAIPSSSEPFKAL